MNRHSLLAVQKCPAREMNGLNPPEPAAVVDVARAVVDQPQDDRESNAAKQAWLYASEHGELVGDVMILEPRQHLAMLRRHPDNDFRFGLFVSAQAATRAANANRTSGTNSKGTSHTRTMRAQDAERKRGAMKNISHFPRERRGFWRRERQRARLQTGTHQSDEFFANSLQTVPLDRLRPETLKQEIPQGGLFTDLAHRAANPVDV